MERFLGFFSFFPFMGFSQSWPDAELQVVLNMFSSSSIHGIPGLPK